MLKGPVGLVECTLAQLVCSSLLPEHTECCAHTQCACISHNQLAHHAPCPALLCQRMSATVDMLQEALEPFDRELGAPITLGLSQSPSWSTIMHIATVLQQQSVRLRVKCKSLTKPGQLVADESQIVGGRKNRLVFYTEQLSFSYEKSEIYW